MRMLLVCVCALAANFAPAAEISPTDNKVTPRNDIPGLINFAQVSDTLYRGGLPTETKEQGLTKAGCIELKKMGIKTIINLRAIDDDRNSVTSLKMQYLKIACKDGNVKEDDLVTFLKAALDPKNQPVFVHCARGADRTGTAVAVYRVVMEGWTPEKAAKEAKDFGAYASFEWMRDYLKKLDVEALKKKVEKADEVKVGKAGEAGEKKATAAKAQKSPN